MMVLVQTASSLLVFSAKKSRSAELMCSNRGLLLHASVIADLLTCVNAIVVRRRKPLPSLTQAEVHSDITPCKLCCL